jgi:hypothetical protein
MSDHWAVELRRLLTANENALFSRDDGGAREGLADLVKSYVQQERSALSRSRSREDSPINLDIFLCENQNGSNLVHCV